MKNQPMFMLQALESRTFLSVSALADTTPPPIGSFTPSPEIVADREQLQKDTRQLRVDRRAGAEQIAEDRKAIAAELEKLRASTPDLEDQLKSLRDKLAADRKACNKEIRHDLAAIREKTKEFAPLIRADRKALRKAQHSHEQAAIDAAKKKLSADRATVENALKPLTDELKADRKHCADVLAADREAIQHKLEQLDPALKPLFDKLEADQKALETKLIADRTAIQSDLDKLRDDLKKLADQHQANA
jgi:hypothetical protein